MTYTIPLKEIKKGARKNGNGRKTGDSDRGNLRSAQEITECERIKIDGDIPVDMPVSNEQHFLFISHDQTVLTHGLHRYPAKFFPELPRWLIRRYSQKYDMVLYPFSGSGTTNVEALLNRRHSVGIDVDPFSRYLSKVKTTPLDEGEMTESCEELLHIVTEFDPSYVDEKDIPEFPYRDKWFNREILVELAYIKKCIEELDVCIHVKDFYRICFSSIIRSVSNADNHCTRTVIRKKLNKKVYPGDGLTQFAEAVSMNVPKMISFSRECPHDISTEFPETCDARLIKYDDDYFDLAVTSPPYANAVDYPRTHQLEMYWLGFASGSLTPLKRKHVGTENVRAHEYNSLHKTGIPEADYVISKIYKKDPRRAYIMYKYLSDMEKNLNEVYKKLKRNSRYVVVVGSNKIRGETFENWIYIMKMAECVGFQIEKWFASEIIRHFIKVPREERITTDWIVVLKK
jgi:DNA modification methylase